MTASIFALLLVAASAGADAATLRVLGPTVSRSQVPSWR